MAFVEWAGTRRMLGLNMRDGYLGLRLGRQGSPDSP